MPIAFVYGALMVHPEALARGEAAYVEDHAVRFTLRGLPWLEPAFAALEPSPGSRAWGVVGEWTEAAWSRAVRRERPYVPRPVVAVTTRGARVEALALFVRRTSRSARSEGLPSARYAGLLSRAAEHHGFPEDVRARYRSLVEGGTPWTSRIADLLGLSR